MISLSKKRIQLIIILLLVLLISAIWIWYGIRLKEIEQQKEEAGIFHQPTKML